VYKTRDKHDTYLRTLNGTAICLFFSLPCLLQFLSILSNLLFFLFILLGNLASIYKFFAYGLGPIVRPWRIDLNNRIMVTGYWTVKEYYNSFLQNCGTSVSSLIEGITVVFDALSRQPKAMA
jgi:hypothetical protein